MESSLREPKKFINRSKFLKTFLFEIIHNFFLTSMWLTDGGKDSNKPDRAQTSDAFWQSACVLITELPLKFFSIVIAENSILVKI